MCACGQRRAITSELGASEAAAGGDCAALPCLVAPPQGGILRISSVALLKISLCRNKAKNHLVAHKLNARSN